MDRDDSSEESVDDDALIDQELKQHAVVESGGNLNNFTFQGGSLKNHDEDFVSKMQSIENVREYLESEIGEKKLLEIYPRLLTLGDDLFMDDYLLQEMLADLLTEQEVHKYAAFFATLVFYEKQTEQMGGDVKAEIDANKSLRNLSQMTAAFGRA